MLPSMVICNGKRLYRDWFTEVDDQNTMFTHSAKGYIADKLAIKYLQAFNIATKEHAQRKPRFLLMDGHHTIAALG